MKELYTRVYEQKLEAEMDNHLGYEKYSNQGDHSGTPKMVVTKSRFRQRWVSLLLFKLPVIEKAILSLLWFLSIDPVAYLLNVLLSLFMPKA